MKSTILKSSLFILLVTFVIACAGKKEEKTADSSTETSTEVKSSESGISQEKLQGMLTAYFSIKDALVETDASKAKSAAASLLSSVGGGMTEIKSLASSMSKEEDVEALRGKFDTLSQEMYTLVKDNKEAKEGTIYKQFCPMAFNNKGAFWLSKEEQVKNPYFGDKMLTCGKVKEEL